MATKKSAVYFPPQNSFSIEGNCVLCNGDKGKISGTYLGAILGCNPYVTPFKAAIACWGLADEDLSDNPAIKVGHALEDRIIHYGRTVYLDLGTFLTAEEAGFPERKGNHNDWKPDFDNPVFTGHIDGVVVEDDGKQYILECKTSRGMRGWGSEYEIDGAGNVVVGEDGNPVLKHNGVPDHYYWQVALYNEMMPSFQKDYAYVIVGSVTDETYADPDSWEPSAENVKLIRMPIDRADVQSKLEIAREWYSKYILAGKSPDYNMSVPADCTLWAHLNAVVSDDGKIASEIDRYAHLCSIIDEYMSKIDEIIKERDTLKESIKDYMNLNGKSQMLSEGGNVSATLSTTTRKTVDTARIASDYAQFGLNLADYTTVSVSKSFKLTQPKPKGDGKEGE